MYMIWATNKSGKIPKLLSQSQKDFIFIIYSLSQEWDELTACPLETLCKCNGRQFLYRVEAKLEHHTHNKIMTFVNITRSPVN